jgi:hypothetical protein
MIWLTWRQFRTSALVMLVALVAFAVTLAVTGPQLLHLSDTYGKSFLDQVVLRRVDRTVYFTGVALVYAVPGLIGIFWGAPLISRELDGDTHRLVWNQSVTRTRWLAVKLGVVGLVAMAASGAVSLAFTWWMDPIDKALDKGRTAGVFEMPRLSPAMFGGHGIAPIGYAAFAVVLGAAAGMVVRRPVPAIAVTLAVFVAVQIAMPLWVRPHLATPVRVTTTITSDSIRGITARPGPNGPVGPFHLQVGIDKPGAWVLSDRVVDADGNPVSAMPSWIGNCMPVHMQGKPSSGTPATMAACFAKLKRLGYRQQATYLPANRFWTVQWRETAIFLGLAGVLAGFCFWRTRRLS